MEEIKFIIPEEVKKSFKEEDLKGLNVLGEIFTKQLAESAKGFIKAEDLQGKMSAALQSWAKDNNVTGDKLKQLEDSLTKLEGSLTEQGKALTSLKEAKARIAGDVTLKDMFHKSYDKLVDSIKSENKTVVIKADPDAIDSSLIEGRGAVSTATGADLVEQGKVDPNLYLKRRACDYVRDIADVATVAKVPETYAFDEEGDESGAIALVDENGLKPQVNLKLIRNKVDVKKAAGYIVVTEELMKFRTRAWARIQSLFRDKVYRDYENIITGEVLASASQYISTPLDGTIAKPTELDAIIAAMCQLEQLEFVPDTLVINPSDKWKLALTTSPSGQYIFAYATQGGKFNILSLNVITTNKVAAGSFLLGEAGTWKIEEELPQLRTGFVNDDFLHNRHTIVGEIFFIVYLPSNLAGAWINASFADVKEALAADGGTEQPTEQP
jgi:hypothetical protein